MGHYPDEDQIIPWAFDTFPFPVMVDGKTVDLEPWDLRPQEGKFSQ